MPGVLRQPELARIIAVCGLRFEARGPGEEACRRAVMPSPQAIGGRQGAPGLPGNPRQQGHGRGDDQHPGPLARAAGGGGGAGGQGCLCAKALESDDRRRPPGQRCVEGEEIRVSDRFASSAPPRNSCAPANSCATVPSANSTRSRSACRPIPAGGKAKEMPVPATFDYNSWLGSTPQVDYTEDRCHPQQGFGRPGWLRLEQFGAGMITGWGSHHIDIAHWAMGTEQTGPIAVDAKATFPDKSSFWNVHGKYQVVLQYANGVAMTISDELPNGVLFEGDNGWIWVSRGGAAATASDPPASQKATKAFNSSDPALAKADLTEHQVQLHKSPEWDHHLDWLEAMRERKEAVTTGEAAHRTCSICLISSIGMKLGRPLKWDPATEHFDDPEANQLLNRPERAPFGAFNAAKQAGFTEFKTSEHHSRRVPHPELVRHRRGAGAARGGRRPVRQTHHPGPRAFPCGLGAGRRLPAGGLRPSTSMRRPGRISTSTSSASTATTPAPTSRPTGRRKSTPARTSCSGCWTRRRATWWSFPATTRARRTTSCVPSRPATTCSADKPMVITPADFEKLQQAFAEAEKRGVLLYDIMTERHEITTILQRELSRMPAIFGNLEEGHARNTRRSPRKASTITSRPSPASRCSARRGSSMSPSRARASSMSPPTWWISCSGRHSRSGSSNPPTSRCWRPAAGPPR